jgi:hypothetical protein
MWGEVLNQSREATQAELLLSLASARFVGQQTVGIAQIAKETGRTRQAVGSFGAVPS